MQQKVDMKTKKRVEQVDKLQKKLEDLRTTLVNELWENIIRKRFEVIKILFCSVHLIITNHKFYSFKGAKKWFTRRVFEEYRRIKSVPMECPQIPFNPE